MAEDRQTYRKTVAKSESLQKKRARSGSSGNSGRSIKDGARGLASRIESGSASGRVTGFSASRKSTAGGKGASGRGGHAVDSFKTRFFSSRVAMVVALVVIAVLAVGVFDSAANSGKAFGNVTVNGQSVAGMTEDQIREMLEREYAQKITDGTVRIYADEKSQDKGQSDIARQESIAQAEQVSVEDAKASTSSWVTSASELRATIPYDKVIAEALMKGREGGPLERLKLFIMPQDVSFSLDFDDDAVDDLASRIDEVIGDLRIDSTVVVDEGVANAEKGHDGQMVDRSWFSERIAEALLSGEEEPSFVAVTSDAPSRTTYDQAKRMSASINRALNSGLSFTYRTQAWAPDAETIGNWTKVKVAEVEGGYDLKVGIDSSAATSDLVKHLDATFTSGDVVIDFEKADDQVLVKTSGSGVIPEVGSAVERVGEVLYGQDGVAWGNDAVDTHIEVSESNAPESLTFEQALDLSLITVIGEYTTEFSDAEGTEHRNHNIKLAADILNDTITDSNGGTWSFNDHSGDTNQDPPFESAGSIINGEYVDSIGGGVCQVATTVFNAVYEAGLNIDDRKNHSLYIESYPTGRDAAVSYPEMDFVWSNPLKSDVLLTLSYTDTTLTAKLYSTPTGYKVSTETGEWEEGEKYHTEFETDDSIGEGSYYIKTTGTDGSQISITRTVEDIDGNIVKQDYFASVYSPKNEVYIVGPGTDTGKLMRDESESSDAEGDEWDDQEDEEEYADDEAQDEDANEGEEIANADEDSFEDYGYDEY